MSLSSTEKSRHNDVNALFFSASSKTDLFFSLSLCLRSQVATSYFSSLAAGGADLIQHILAFRTPCCSPPHSRMAADEARGGRGHRAGYSAIIMYLQKPPHKKPHIRIPHSFPRSVLVPYAQNMIFEIMQWRYLENEPFHTYRRRVSSSTESAMLHRHVFYRSPEWTNRTLALETASGMFSGQHANAAWCH